MFTEAHPRPGVLTAGQWVSNESTPSPIPRRALTKPALSAALDGADQRRRRITDVAKAISAEDGTVTALTLITSIH